MNGLDTRFAVWMEAWKTSYEKTGNSTFANFEADECVNGFDVKFGLDRLVGGPSKTESAPCGPQFGDPAASTF